MFRFGFNPNASAPFARTHRPAIAAPAGLVLDVEVNFRRCAVLVDFLVVDLHVKFRDPRPFHSMDCLRSFRHRIGGSFLKALFRNTDDFDYFLRHNALLREFSGPSRYYARWGLSLPRCEANPMMSSRAGLNVKTWLVVYSQLPRNAVPLPKPEPRVVRVPLVVSLVRSVAVGQLERTCVRKGIDALQPL